jgi:calcineurin-like phosphoesterase family protein
MLNLKDKEDQKIYVTSDLHLGHLRDFVWAARGYSSAEQHDEGVIQTLNEVVRPNDILFMLGDLCLNAPMDKVDGYLDRIKCQNLYCLWGNHNNPHEKAVYRKLVPSGQQYPVRYKNMVYQGHYLETVLNGQFVVLFHYPISVWNEMKNGSWMLCGHSHHSFEQSKAEHVEGKILDVGWDGNARPWTLPEIAAVMAKKTVIAVDHHQ